MEVLQPLLVVAVVKSGQLLRAQQPSCKQEAHAPWDEAEGGGDICCNSANAQRARRNGQQRTRVISR